MPIQFERPPFHIDHVPLQSLPSSLSKIEPDRPCPASLPVMMRMMVNTSCLLLIATTFLVTSPLGVEGFASGAGQCLVGEASVGSPHLPSTSGDTSLSGNGIEVSVDGTVLDPLTPFTVASGTEHTITISATGTTPFRGFLYALSIPADGTIDLSAALVPTDTVTGQIAGVCASPLVGVTHTSNADKTSVSATFVLDQDAELALDVTVVLQNTLSSGGVSQYGYAGYQLINSASTTTSTPTAAPVATVPVTSAPVTSVPTSAAPVTAVPTTAVPAPTTASDVPSSVPTYGGGGASSDYPSLIPSVEIAPPSASSSSPVSSPTAPTTDRATSGAVSTTAGALFGSAVAAGLVSVILSSLAL